jgi:hypothetical protein
MPSTYEPIATYTVVTAEPTISFSSIPQTYTDLVIVLAGSYSSQADIALRFNGDTASNYSRTVIYGNGSNALSTRDTSNTLIAPAYFSTSRSVAIISIMNYTNTTTYKTVFSRSNDASANVSAVVGLWRKTPEAINSLTLSYTNIAIGTTCTLYGIKAA